MNIQRCKTIFKIFITLSFLGMIETGFARSELIPIGDLINERHGEDRDWARIVTIPKTGLRFIDTGRYQLYVDSIGRLQIMNPNVRGQDAEGFLSWLRSIQWHAGVGWQELSGPSRILPVRILHEKSLVDALNSAISKGVLKGNELKEKYPEYKVSDFIDLTPSEYLSWHPEAEPEAQAIFTQLEALQTAANRSGERFYLQASPRGATASDAYPYAIGFGLITSGAWTAMLELLARPRIDQRHAVVAGAASVGTAILAPTLVHYFDRFSWFANASKPLRGFVYTAAALAPVAVCIFTLRALGAVH